MNDAIFIPAKPRLWHDQRYECLDCGRVTDRSPAMAYECPVCASLESIPVEGMSKQRHPAST